jgi:hypothetical protein
MMESQITSRTGFILALMRASGNDAPCARKRGTWLQPDQGVPGPKCVRRAGHGLDGKAVPVDVGKRIAAEEHQVGVALVDPERDPSPVVGISKFDTSEAILVSLEVGERVVERRRADPPRLPEIVFRVLHGFRADRKAALVGPQDGSPGHAQHQTIDGCGPEGQIRMSAAPVGTRVRADVRGRCPHAEAVQAAQRTRPWIALRCSGSFSGSWWCRPSNS